jgi:hypothetical protein
MSILSWIIKNRDRNGCLGPFGSLTKSSLLLNDVNPPVIHETSAQQSYHGQDSLHLVQGKLTEILSGTGRQNLEGASKRPLSKFWLPNEVNCKNYTSTIYLKRRPNRLRLSSLTSPKRSSSLRKRN